MAQESSTENQDQTGKDAPKPPTVKQLGVIVAKLTETVNNRLFQLEEAVSNLSPVAGEPDDLAERLAGLEEALLKFDEPGIDERFAAIEAQLEAIANAQQAPATAAPTNSNAAQHPEGASPMERLEKLEQCVSKMATLSGNANHLPEFGLKRWEPSQNDMRKYKS
jgi:hypothetical protein